MSTPSSALDVPYRVSTRVDRASGKPLYLQVAEPLEQRIRSGALEPGRLIEDEISLAERLSISRATARHALSYLVNRGLVQRRRGSGTRVAPHAVRRPLSLTSLNDDLERGGFGPHTDVIAYAIRLADAADSAAVGCEVGEEVVSIERLRWIKDERLGLMRNTMRSEVAPSLTALSSKGLYACLRERGIIPVSAVQTVGARVANAHDAEMLGVEEGSALLTTERTSFDETGAVVEHGSHVYVASLYSFELNLVAG